LIFFLACINFREFDQNGIFHGYFISRIISPPKLRKLLQSDENKGQFEKGEYQEKQKPINLKT